MLNKLLKTITTRFSQRMIIWRTLRDLRQCDRCKLWAGSWFISPGKGHNHLCDGCFYDLEAIARWSAS